MNHRMVTAWKEDSWLFVFLLVICKSKPPHTIVPPSLCCLENSLHSGTYSAFFWTCRLHLLPPTRFQPLGVKFLYVTCNSFCQSLSFYNLLILPLYQFLSALSTPIKILNPSIRCPHKLFCSVLFQREQLSFFSQVASSFPGIPLKVALFPRNPFECLPFSLESFWRSPLFPWNPFATEDLRLFSHLSLSDYSEFDIISTQLSAVPA